MTTLWWIMASGFLLNIAIGLGFVTSRKGSAESLLAALLLGTAGVAVALVLGEADCPAGVWRGKQLNA